MRTEVEKPLPRADEAFRDARGEFLPWEHPPPRQHRGNPGPPDPCHGAAQTAARPQKRLTPINRAGAALITDLRYIRNGAGPYFTFRSHGPAQAQLPAAAGPGHTGAEGGGCQYSHGTPVRPEGEPDCLQPSDRVPRRPRGRAHSGERLRLPRLDRPYSRRPHRLDHPGPSTPAICCGACRRSPASYERPMSSTPGASTPAAAVPP